MAFGKNGKRKKGGVHPCSVVRSGFQLEAEDAEGNKFQFGELGVAMHVGACRQFFGTDSIPKEVLVALMRVLHGYFEPDGADRFDGLLNMGGGADVVNEAYEFGKEGGRF